MDMEHGTITEEYAEAFGLDTAAEPPPAATEGPQEAPQETAGETSGTAEGTDIPQAGETPQAAQEGHEGGTGGAERPPEMSQEERRQWAARRRQWAEQERRRAEQERVDGIYREVFAGQTDPFTGKPITTEAEYRAYQARQRQTRESQQLQDAGIAPEAIRGLVAQELAPMRAQLLRQEMAAAAAADSAQTAQTEAERAKSEADRAGEETDNAQYYAQAAAGSASAAAGSAEAAQGAAENAAQEAAEKAAETAAGEVSATLTAAVSAEREKAEAAATAAADSAQTAQTEAERAKSEADRAATVAGGGGDMTKAVYDPQGAVAQAGGIVRYGAENYLPIREYSGGSKFVDVHGAPMFDASRICGMKGPAGNTGDQGTSVLTFLAEGVKFECSYLYGKDGNGEVKLAAITVGKGVKDDEAVNLGQMTAALSGKADASHIHENYVLVSDLTQKLATINDRLNTIENKLKNSSNSSGEKETPLPTIPGGTVSI